jgi:hypothetical protein
MKKINISKEIEEMRPTLEGFVECLGYTCEQGKKFAEGYITEMKRLPIDGQRFALTRMYEPGMLAGFKSAGINESEAFNLAREIESHF